MVKKRLKKVEREEIFSELEILRRFDLIDNEKLLGDIYFIERVWELYDIIYEVGRQGDSIYVLSDMLERDRDLILKWSKGDEKINYYYNMGLRARQLEVRSLIDYMNQERATRIEYGIDEKTGQMVITRKYLDKKILLEEDARFDSKLSEENVDSDIVSSILSEDDEDEKNVE